MLKKIISGGQTGADRAALDVARRMDIPHGGWIPKERLATVDEIGDQIIDELSLRDQAAHANLPE